MAEVEKSNFKQDAKQIVDIMFEQKLFRDDLTRDDMNELEGLIKYMMDSRLNSILRLRELKQKIETRKGKVL